MKNVCVFTGTRAEYGLLYWLLKDIQTSATLNLQLLVSGMHLSPEFGLTYKDIERDGFFIDEKVEMLLSSDTPVGIAKSIGLAILGLTDALSRLKPDVLIILGDRFEALAAAQTAMILKIPIMHLHGGEITEGAYDDAMRHAITKLSYIHCTSTEEHRKRVIQLGETPERVFNVGAIGLDHLVRSEILSLAELSQSIDFTINKPYFLVTYHPVTLANEDPINAFSNLLKSLDQFLGYQVIFTYPNADEGGRQIIPLLENYAKDNSERVFTIKSLGQKRYLSAVKHASVVIGNSSSGIIEVPSLKVPTINIGLRQLGRSHAKSVFHCAVDEKEITHAIENVLEKSHEGIIDYSANPYGTGEVSQKIINILENVNVSLNVVKTFYDLEVNLV